MPLLVILQYVRHEHRKTEYTGDSIAYLRLLCHQPFSGNMDLIFVTPTLVVSELDYCNDLCIEITLKKTQKVGQKDITRDHVQQIDGAAIKTGAVPRYSHVALDY